MESPKRWSRGFDRCEGCGTTERPHEAKGRCARCYDNWRYNNDVAARERHKAQAKRYRMSEGYAPKQAARIARYNSKTENVERHRKIRTDWAAKHSRWQIGARVQVHIADLAQWSDNGKPPRYPDRTGPAIFGTIVSRTNVAAVVRFATFEERVTFARMDLAAGEAST